MFSGILVLILQPLALVLSKYFHRSVETYLPR